MMKLLLTFVLATCTLANAVIGTDIGVAAPSRQSSSKSPSTKSPHMLRSFSEAPHTIILDTTLFTTLNDVPTSGKGKGVKKSTKSPTRKGAKKSKALTGKGAKGSTKSPKGKGLNKSTKSPSNPSISTVATDENVGNVGLAFQTSNGEVIKLMFPCIVSTILLSLWM